MHAVLSAMRCGAWAWGAAHGATAGSGSWQQWRAPATTTTAAAAARQPTGGCRASPTLVLPTAMATDHAELHSPGGLAAAEPCGSWHSRRRSCGQGRLKRDANVSTEGATMKYASEGQGHRARCMQRAWHCWLSSMCGPLLAAAATAPVRHAQLSRQPPLQWCTACAHRSLQAVCSWEGLTCCAAASRPTAAAACWRAVHRGSAAASCLARCPCETCAPRPAAALSQGQAWTPAVIRGSAERRSA